MCLYISLGSKNRLVPDSFLIIVTISAHFTKVCWPFPIEKVSATKVESVFQTSPMSSEGFALVFERQLKIRLSLCYREVLNYSFQPNQPSPPIRPNKVRTTFSIEFLKKFLRSQKTFLRTSFLESFLRHILNLTYPPHR